VVVEPAPEPVPAAPEAANHGFAEPAPAAGAPAPASRSGRPELLVGAAFVGGVAIATVLRRLGRR
jgi:hypothetical protein